MKNQEEWQLELIENPKYTSDWINEASKILANEINLMKKIYLILML